MVRLLQADVIHQATVGRRDRGTIERGVYILALKAFIELAKDSGPDLLERAAPLGRLVMALEDLELGRVAPALRPQKRNRKDTGPRSRRDSTLKGQLAGIVEGLMRRGGRSEPEAARWVHRRLANRGVQLDAEQLIEWRKQARGAKRDDFMRVAFHKMQVVVDWSDPDAAAGALIENFLKLA